jgi:hypothetical protein
VDERSSYRLDLGGSATCYRLARSTDAMAEKLTFSGMTWDILEEKYGIDQRDSVLFEDCSLVEPTPTLVENVRRGLSFRLANERARAHRLVDPVLAELEMFYKGKITTIPEMYLEVKGVPSRLYGCVTTGTDWRFLSFDGDAKQVVLDRTTYLISQLPRLLGIFQYIIDGSLAALEQRHKE